MIIQNILTAYLQPNSTVFDIGAFDGSFSKKYHELGYKVHAFEGSSNNCIRFKEKCKDIDNITLHEVALSDQEKVCKTRFNDCVGEEHPEIEVHYVEFDKYFAENHLPKPDYVKIDIEGMESVVCKKMTNLINSIRPVFQIEIHNAPKFKRFKYSDYPSFVGLEEGGFDFSVFLDAGYRSYLYKFGQLIPTKNFHRHAQYFFIPKEKDNNKLPLRKLIAGARGIFYQSN